MFKSGLRKINPFWYLYAYIINPLWLFMSKIELPASSIIGRNLFLPHGYGLAIGPSTKIGNNVTLGPWVVIGHNFDAGCPTLLYWP